MAKKTYTRSDTNALVDDLGDSDMPHTLLDITTAHHILIFTSKGSCYRVNVADFPEKKWKERGLHLSSMINGFGKDEHVVGSFSYNKMPANGYIIFVTKNGMIKKD